ncbi:MAG TPA: TolC family protein [Pyrinomonadaceae bacterium]|jgi:HAE1 family hydrophobic/amphiphilic exporter-1
MHSKSNLISYIWSHFSAFAFALLFLTGTASLARAQQPTPSPEPPSPVPPAVTNYRTQQRPLPEMGRVGVDTSRNRPLSLRDAISMALQNNKDIEVERDHVKMAEFDLLGARGAYDPKFSTTAFYERVENPISSFLSGGSNGATTTTDYTGTARFEGLGPKLGGSYHIDFSSIRLTTNNVFAALNPTYPSALTFSYTQPLLRGLKFDNTRRQVEIAKKNLSLTDAQFRQRAIETITNVQRAYWDLVFALRNVQIQVDAVRVARSQLEHNQRLVQEGQLAPIDVVAAEAQITTFEQDVYSALEEVSKTENNLKNLIAENQNSALWSEPIVPTDSVDLVVPDITLPDALKTAMENRPELQASNVVREINEIDQRFFKDQKKPGIDLVGSYGMVGLAGAVSTATNPFTGSSAQLRDAVNRLLRNANFDPLPDPPAQTISPNLIGSYPQSVENLLANRFNNFRVGVQINLPLRNRTAEAQYGRSLVEAQQIATQREQLEQNIQVEVRNALQAMRSAQARLQAAAATRAANERQLTSEQRKLDAGQSTTFLVLERQTALTAARGAELKAQTDLNKAIADLHRATGNALRVNSVVVNAK